MRKIFYAILIAGILTAFAAPVKAQVSLDIGVNISSQPIWGPTGYDNVQYYYLPDIDVYYYVPQHRFYYQSGGSWIYSSNLPPSYANYDLYSGYKVVINENRPYLHDQDYRVKYSSYKNRHDQQPIRDSKDSKYFVIKNHPEHNNWVKQQGHTNVQANKQVKGNRQVQGNKRAPGNKQAPGNRQAPGNKQAPGNRQVQGNKQAQGDKNRQDDHKK